ncbi:MAG: Gfo/Idh/MocA family protein [Chloroflexota bacterium]
MSEDGGFVNMGSAGGRNLEAPVINIGMLGYAFMGKAHSHAFKTMPHMMWPPPAIPRLVSICGRNEASVSEAAVRYGFDRYTIDWQELVEDPEIQVFDNLTPNNLHAEPSILAARLGKHVLCEKPLARSAEEAKSMLDAVEAAGIVHMVGFNYRFVPALRLAYDLIKSGRLGEIYHFRGQYLQEWVASPGYPMVWRLQGDIAGSGALGDLGSHTIDLARWLLGEIGAVSGLTRTFIPERLDQGGDRREVTVDDAMLSLLEFESGAIGTLEASRFGTGRKNFHSIEINGSRGSIQFNMERLNELKFYSTDDPPDVQGFHDVLVTEAHHPFYSYWWPQGHIIGWEHTFIHEVHHFLRAIAQDQPVAPLGATFLDGYRNAIVSDGILESARTGRRVVLSYTD